MGGRLSTVRWGAPKLAALADLTHGATSVLPRSTSVPCSRFTNPCMLTTQSMVTQMRTSSHSQPLQPHAVTTLAPSMRHTPRPLSTRCPNGPRNRGCGKSGSTDERRVLREKRGSRYLAKFSPFRPAASAFQPCQHPLRQAIESFGAVPPVHAVVSNIRSQCSMPSTGPAASYSQPSGHPPAGASAGRRIPPPVEHDRRHRHW